MRNNQMSNSILPFLHEKKKIVFVICLDAKFYVHCNIYNEIHFGNEKENKQIQKSF